MVTHISKYQTAEPENKLELGRASKKRFKDILWKLIFVLSRGAIAVLANAPAKAPAISDVIILFLFDI